MKSKPIWLSMITAKILVLIYFFVVFWLISIIFRGIQETTENYSFSLFYSIIPLAWGVIGFMNSRLWGSFSSYIGKAVFFLSAGIFSWGIANLIFAYYNLILKIPVPYPSFADPIFFLLYPFSAVGVFYLFRAIGASFGLNQMSGKIGLLIIPLFFIWISYHFLFEIARGGEIVYADSNLIQAVLDIIFPIGSVIVGTMATLTYGLSIKYLGGFFRKSIIFILIGFFFVYIADLLYSYNVATEKYFVGMWVDIFYPTAFLFISVGLSLLNPKLLSNPLSDIK